MVESRGWPCWFRPDLAPQPLLSAREAFEKAGEASVDLRVWFAPEGEAIYRLYSPEQIDVSASILRSIGLR